MESLGPSMHVVTRVGCVWRSLHTTGHMTQESAHHFEDWGGEAVLRGCQPKWLEVSHNPLVLISLLV